MGGHVEFLEAGEGARSFAKDVHLLDYVFDLHQLLLQSRINLTIKFHLRIRLASLHNIWLFPLNDPMDGPDRIVIRRCRTVPRQISMQSKRPLMRMVTFYIFFFLLVFVVGCVGVVLASLTNHLEEAVVAGAEVAVSGVLVDCLLVMLLLDCLRESFLFLSDSASVYHVTTHV